MPLRKYGKKTKRRYFRVERENLRASSRTKKRAKYSLFPIVIDLDKNFCVVTHRNQWLTVLIEHSDIVRQVVFSLVSDDND